MEEKRTVEEKSMHPIAFWILLIAVIAGLCYGVYNLIWVIRALAIANAFTSMGLIGDVLASAGLPNIVDIFYKTVYGITIAIYVISLLIYVLFLLKLLKNKKEPINQKYQNPLWVIAIISLVWGLISIFSGDYVSIIALAINAAFVVGIIMQRNYKPAN